MNTVRAPCDSALLLDYSSVIEEGAPNEVIDAYNLILARKVKGEETQENFKVEIVDTKMFNEHRQKSEIFVSGKRCTVEIALKDNETIADITVGILIRNRFGQDIFGTNTYHKKTPIGLIAVENCVVSHIIDELNIGSAKCTVTLAIHKGAAHVDECCQ